MNRSDFFGTVYPAPSSGLNVHRLRAALDSGRFVADCAGALNAAVSPQDVSVSPSTEDATSGSQNGAQRRFGAFPRYARFRDQRVRVLYYESPDRFRILLADDTQRTVSRSDLVFFRTPKLG